ncbi:TPA: hypothetical protein ABHN85_09390 [Pseudomonas sp. H2]|uniref:Uncharacterized protein n=1 Tax=Pseudomonas capeferrum TaxID=1495066 RepID=A0ABY7R355_9PSED|nr:MULTISPECIES: hypothetical protein [Pseudomonas]WCH97893.1 hypothetical protein PMC74_13935 [Pseudomonas capeferrum]
MTDLIEAKTSTYFLQAAIDVQAERGKQYDAPDGTRSIVKTVQAFNAITGRDLTEAEGWLLMQIVKDVRQWQNPDKYHEDSALDGVAYASLKAEALAAGDKPWKLSEKSSRRRNRATGLTTTTCAYQSPSKSPLVQVVETLYLVLVLAHSLIGSARGPSDESTYHTAICLYELLPRCLRLGHHGRYIFREPPFVDVLLCAGKSLLVLLFHRILSRLPHCICAKT